MTKQERYHQRKPWVRYIAFARRRCNDTTDKRWYPYYGAKGITCELKAADAEFLWERDAADKLRRPSLDRINSALGYTRDNCRFIEWDENTKIARDKRRGEPDAPPLSALRRQGRDARVLPAAGRGGL